MDLKAGGIATVPRATPEPADARERWYRLHRARREIRKADQDIARQLQAMASSNAISDARRRMLLAEATDRLTHPPYVIDPELPGV